jgi:hypothetical protein
MVILKHMDDAKYYSPGLATKDDLATLRLLRVIGPCSVANAFTNTSKLPKSESLMSSSIRCGEIRVFSSIRGIVLFEKSSDLTHAASMKSMPVLVQPARYVNFIIGRADMRFHMTASPKSQPIIDKLVSVALFDCPIPIIPSA